MVVINGIVAQGCQHPSSFWHTDEELLSPTCPKLVVHQAGTYHTCQQGPADKSL